MASCGLDASTGWRRWLVSAGIWAAVVLAGLAGVVM
jgi:hypothetical protein